MKIDKFKQINKFLKFIVKIILTAMNLNAFASFAWFPQQSTVAVGSLL